MKVGPTYVGIGVQMRFCSSYRCPSRDSSLHDKPWGEVRVCRSSYSIIISRQKAMFLRRKSNLHSEPSASFLQEGDTQCFTTQFHKLAASIPSPTTWTSVGWSYSIDSTSAWSQYRYEPCNLNAALGRVDFGNGWRSVAERCIA